MSTGKAWEAQLRAACVEYHRAGRLTWQRNHPEVHVQSKAWTERIRGRMTRVFQASWGDPGPCDFSGELLGGRGWTFDAKDCEGDRWGFAELEDHQVARLDGCHAMGGLALVALRLQGDGWVLPWRDLRGPWVAWDNLRRQRKRASARAASWGPADGFGLPMVGAGWLDACVEAGLC